MSLAKVKSFNRILFEFIDKLSRAFPETIDETNLKTIIATLDPLKKDKCIMPENDETEIKKSATFHYMIQFYDHISKIAEHLIAKNEDIFNETQKKKYKTPKLILVDIDIDLHKLWKHKDITDETKKIIMTYLSLLTTIAEGLINEYKISNKAKKQILRNKIVNAKFQNELKKKIYDIIGKDGKNETVDKMIDEILSSVQKNKHMFSKGQITPEKLQNMMGGLHKKMMDKYEQGELDENDLKSTFKSLMKNILGNKDVNLKESIGSVMEMMKATGNEEMLNMIDENMTEDDLRNKFEEISTMINEEVAEN